MLTIYVYLKCNTCRDALKWLDLHKIAHEVKAIRETPPSKDELTAAITEFGGDFRKVFNTSGLDFRSLGLKDQLSTVSEIAVLELLSKNGNLVKRPFLIGDGKVLVGFKESVWGKSLR